MGNFVYFKYTKLWKNVYFKYTKLNRWSLRADKHCSYGMVFTDRSPFWAVLAPSRFRPYACIEDCAAWRRSQRASLIVTSVSTQATSENTAPTAPT